MSDPEGFLTRWSRRKREAAERDSHAEAASGEAVETAPESASSLPTGQAEQAEQIQPTEPRARCEPHAPAAEQKPFDPASLPPIDSIEAGTDIRDFLKPGVPPALTRAALRRAWAADPAVRDFVGLAENSWDFTDPDAIEGFGPLLPAHDVQKLLTQVLGNPAKETRSTEPAQAPGAAQSRVEQGAGRGGADEDPGSSEENEGNAITDETLGKSIQQSQADEVNCVELQSNFPVTQQSVEKTNNEDVAPQNERIAGNSSRHHRAPRHGTALPE
jgi:hypothetical protein